MDYSYHSDNETLDRIHEINLRMLTEFDRICTRHQIPYYLFFGGLLGAVRHQDFIPWDNDVDVVMKSADYEELKKYLAAELDPSCYQFIDPADYKEKYFDNIPRIIYTLCDIQMDPGYTRYYNDWANKICLDINFLDRVPETFSGKLLLFRLKFLYGLANGKRYSIDLKNYHGFYKAAAVVLRFFGRFFKADTLRKKIDRLRVRFNRDTSVSTYRITNDQMHTFSLTFPVSAFESENRLPIHGQLFSAPTDTDRILTDCYGDYRTLPPEEARIPHWGFTDILPENFVFVEKS